MREQPRRTLGQALESGELAEATSEPGVYDDAIRSFVALGDSFTAGTGADPGRSWADLLAASLRARWPDLLYRNLAWKGATSDEMLGQVAIAVEIEPDLVSLIAGANDVFETTRPDPDRIAACLTEAFGTLRHAVPGALVVTATIPEHWRHMRLGPRTRVRVAQANQHLNAHLRRIAAERGIPCLDLASHPDLTNAANFAADGLHPSPTGHLKAADAFARLLEVHTGSDQRVGQ